MNVYVTEIARSFRVFCDILSGMVQQQTSSVAQANDEWASSWLRRF